MLSEPIIVALISALSTLFVAYLTFSFNMKRIKSELRKQQLDENHTFYSTLYQEVKEMREKQIRLEIEIDKWKDNYYDLKDYLSKIIQKYHIQEEPPEPKL